MSINHEHTQKSSMPNPALHDSDYPDDDDTSRRVPIVRPAPEKPTTVVPKRPMPAQHYTRSKTMAEQGIIAQSQPTRDFATDLSRQTTTSLPPPAQAPLPFVAATAAPRRKRRNLALPIAAVLAILALLIAVGGYFEQTLLSRSPDGQTPTTQTGQTGPFVQLPLNASQLDALRHLVGYMKYKQLASMYVARMPLDVELGQLIMVEYYDDHYTPELDTMINQLHAGGVIMYEFQMKTFNQTKNDIAQMQRRATFPLLVSTDEEGGPNVHRLKNIYGLRMSATDIYNTGNVNVATQQGHKVAQDLLALGINENLTPDVDVNLVNGYDMVTRTFGNDPQSVIKFAGAYLRAMQSNGVIGCIKHYPGLGDAPNDAHTGLPVVNRTRAQLYSVELAPFKAFIQSQNKLDNPGMIMPTDVLMPAIDPKWPAELSHIFMTDILRKEFGYDGVVLTDALYMKGISNQWSMPEAAVLALNAGNDMLLGPNGPDETIAMLDAIKQALRNGTLAKARVDEAVTRIIALKMAYHLMPAIPPQA